MRHYFLLLFLVLVGLTRTEKDVERLIAIGDVHGDLAQVKAILQLAGVIDASGHWIGGDKVKLIQLGDLVDRGPDDKAVLDFFDKLVEEANAALKEPSTFSPVTLLLGNHELMHLQNDFRFAHKESHDAFGGVEQRRKDLENDGVLGAKLRARKILERYNRTVFVHAGLLSVFATYGVEALNQLAAKALSNNDFYNPLFGARGPLWTRSVVNAAQQDDCGDLLDALYFLDADRMVVGHTPETSQRIGHYCDGRLITVDVGLSKKMYGGLAALEISHDVEKDEAELLEILPNDYEARSKIAMEHIDSNGPTLDKLQEMLQLVAEKEEEKLKA